MSHFPVKSANRAAFARPRRLTGGLPDVGTGEVLHRNLIRWRGKRPSRLKGSRKCLQGAVIAYQSPARTDRSRELSKGSTRMGPSTYRARNAAGRGSRSAGVPRRPAAFNLATLSLATLGVAIACFLGMTASASAQGAVRSVHGDWQIRCDTPPGAQGEQCALIQSVVAEDRSNAGLTVIVLKTADQKSKLMRVVAPLGVPFPCNCGRR